MDCKIIWTERASDDLGALVRYIARRNQKAAQAMGYGIYDCVQVLAAFPEIGSVVREMNHPNWRQLVFRSSRIIYHIDDDAKTVSIVRVWHGARGEADVPL